MRRWSRWLGPAGVGLALTLAGATACNGSSSDSAEQSAVTLVAAVPDKTTQAGTARLAFTANTNVLGRSVAFSGQGVFDFAHHSGRFSFSIPALLGTESVKEVVTPATLYLKIPRVGPAGKYYVVDLKSLGGGTNPFASFGNTDPTAGLEALRGVSSDVHEVGTAEVRGVTTKHYKGTINTAEAAKKVPAFVRDKVRALYKQVPTIPFDVYVDNAGRLRKLTQHMTIPASAATKGQPVTVDLAFEFFDFGTPVTITPPPKDRQVDGAQLLRQFAGGHS